VPRREGKELGGNDRKQLGSTERTKRHSDIYFMYEATNGKIIKLAGQQTPP
jgi:hypothetical protein